MSDVVYGSRTPAEGVRVAPFVMQAWEKPQGLSAAQVNRGNYPMMPEHKRRGPFTLGMLSTSRSIGCFTKPTRAIVHKTPGKKSYSGKSHKKRSNPGCVMPIKKGRHREIEIMQCEAKELRHRAKTKSQLLINIKRLRVRYPYLQLEITRCFLDIVF